MIFKNKIKFGPINTNSKSIFKLYEPVVVLLLIFGYNFDFYDECFLAKLASKTYCLILVAIISYATLSCCSAQEISQGWSLLEYNASVLIILLFKSQIRLFLQKLGEVDTYLRINRRHYHQDLSRIAVITIMIWIARVYYTYSFCGYYVCYNDFSLYIVSQLTPLALDLNRVWRCILFDTVRYRLKILRIRIEENPGDNYYLYIKDRKSVRENKMKFCLKLYRSIADLVELVSPELHASLFVSVACNLPKMVFNTYHILRILEGLEPYGSLNFIIIHIIQISVLLFAPFVVVEFFAVETERIRLFLMHQLIDEVDPQSAEATKLFMEYTRLRPFKYRIWRIIPINISLPLELINLCTNYVIVIINFTHLYG